MYSQEDSALMLVDGLMKREMSGASGERWEKILARTQGRKVIRHGFAPDQEYGQYTVGDVEAHWCESTQGSLEGVVWISVLELGCRDQLVTLARWSEGFLDLLQWVGEAPEGQVALFLEGAVQVREIFEGDRDGLVRVLAQHGDSSWGVGTLLASLDSVSIFHDRAELLKGEYNGLGLVREDMVCNADIHDLYVRIATGAEPSGMLRLWEASRADLLTAVALVHHNTRG